MASLTLSIELESDGEPIHGRLQVTGEPAVLEFTGWIEFIHALERTRLATRPTDAEPRAQSAEAADSPS